MHRGRREDALRPAHARDSRRGRRAMGARQAVPRQSLPGSRRHRRRRRGANRGVIRRPHARNSVASQVRCPGGVPLQVVGAHVHERDGSGRAEDTRISQVGSVGSVRIRRRGRRDGPFMVRTITHKERSRVVVVGRGGDAGTRDERVLAASQRRRGRGRRGHGTRYGAGFGERPEQVAD